jgi:8-oxo-dGTP pyrophosphatase MutT (NUDIX family)
LCYNWDMDLRNITDVIAALRERLEPVERAGSLRDTLEGQRLNARKAAVLLALFEEHGETYLAFIRRASTLRSHSGEIAFPGGSVDTDDVAPVMTALREAREEIGLDPARAEILGILAPVFTVVSNFLVTPVVAFLPQGLGALEFRQAKLRRSFSSPCMVLPIQRLPIARNGRVVV